MSGRRSLLLALLLAGLLLAAPFARAAAESEGDEYDEEEEEEAPAEDSTADKDVATITEKNWDDTVKKSKFALVAFTAPWCGHCQRLKPEWAKAATAIKEQDASIIIANVDATKDAPLAQKYEVQGYPTIKWFVDGELSGDYSGGRDAEAIIKWVKKKTGPAATTLDSKDALAAAEKEAEVLVVGYFKKLKGDEYDAFTKVAQKTEDVVFGETTDSDVAKAAGISSAPGVAVITNFKGEERGSVALKGKVNADSVGELISAEKLPVVIEFNDQNSGKIFGSGIEKQVLLVAPAADLKADSKVFKAFRSAAANHKGKLVFVTVDTDGTSKDPVVNFFGLKDAEAAVVVGFEMTNNKKYKLTEKISDKALDKFASDLAGGKLTPEYKSAAVPEDDNDGGVRVIVGKTFEKIVKDDAKDVLLEVYAPWCGHCKTLEPIYKKLAKRFAKVDSVVIAKMDGTENEHPDAEVKGFPTLIFFPAGGKDAVPFDGGDRSLKSLTKFIKEHATHKFELPKKKKGGDDDGDDEDDAAAAGGSKEEEEAAATKDEL